MDPIVYLQTKFGLTIPPNSRRYPIEIPDTDRETLAHLFAVFGFTRGAEVGVERGAYSEVLLRENPALHLTLVDAWRPYADYRDHVGARKLEGFYEQTLERLAPYAHRMRVLRAWSLEAAAEVEDGSLDFVYIDANHALEYVVADIAAWSPKVRPGGIIAGHDYVPHHWPDRIHVIQATHAWADAYAIGAWFVLGSKAEIPGQRRDKGRSWFWVHQPRPVHTRRARPIHQ